MDHGMRAEYEEGASPPDGRVKTWHMVRGDGLTAMCGRELDERSALQPSDAWGTPAGEPFCHSCGALYLREVP